MFKHVKLYWAPDEKGFRQPGEGPSADRLKGGGGGGVEDESMEGHVVYNQDGTRLGSWEGGSVGNPTGSGIGEIRRNGEFVHAEEDHLPIGGETTVMPEDGERRTVHPGGGGAAPSDFNTSGQLGGDASNIGAEGDNQYGE
ncbi:hypothetical protein D3C72_938310 [compost metagenome]